MSLMYHRALGRKPQYKEDARVSTIQVPFIQQKRLLGKESTIIRCDKGLYEYLNKLSCKFSHNNYRLPTFIFFKLFLIKKKSLKLYTNLPLYGIESIWKISTLSTWSVDSGPRRARLGRIRNYFQAQQRRIFLFNYWWQPST